MFLQFYFNHSRWTYNGVVNSTLASRWKWTFSICMIFHQHMVNEREAALMLLCSVIRHYYIFFPLWRVALTITSPKLELFVLSWGCICLKHQLTQTIISVAVIRCIDSPVEYSQGALYYNCIRIWANSYRENVSLSLWIHWFTSGLISYLGEPGTMSGWHYTACQLGQKRFIFIVRGVETCFL